MDFGLLVASHLELEDTLEPTDLQSLSSAGSYCSVAMGTKISLGIGMMKYVMVA